MRLVITKEEWELIKQANTKIRTKGHRWVPDSMREQEADEKPNFIFFAEVMQEGQGSMVITIHSAPVTW